MELEKSVIYGSSQAVLQNLKDAGCTDEMVQRIMVQLYEDNFNELLKQLEQHRACLLSMVHEKEKQIDCLDYLVYQIKRYHSQKKERRA